MMKSPKVSYAMNTCGEKDPHLSSVKLTVIIYENGRMRLVNTEPDVGDDLDLCLRRVIGRIRMPMSGSKHKMAYTFKFKQWAPDDAMDGRHSSDDSGQVPWNDQYSKGKKLLIPGIIFSFLGSVPLACLTSIFVVDAIWRHLFWDPETDLPDMKTGLAITIPGLALFLLGQVLTIVGGRKSRDAKKMKKDFYMGGVMIVPSPLENGVVMSAVMRF